MKKKIVIFTVLAFALAPVAAFATPTPAQQAAKDCAALRAKMGVSPFVQAFASPGTSNAFGKCVSKFAQVERANLSSANTLCAAEQADPNFAANHGGKTFAQVYGTNTDLSNAFGNCVAQKLQAATTKMQASLTSASKTCRAMRSSDPAGFRSKYGSRSNAFAKCVVAQAHTK